MILERRMKKECSLLYAEECRHSREIKVFNRVVKFSRLCDNTQTLMMSPSNARIEKKENYEIDLPFRLCNLFFSSNKKKEGYYNDIIKTKFVDFIQTKKTCSHVSFRLLSK